MEEKKEMTMEVRLLIAFLLMGIVIFGTQYFYKPPPQPTSKAVATKTTEAPKEAPVPVEKPKPAPVPAPDVAGVGQVHADKEETVTVDTNLYRVVFSNRGAVVRSWILKAYKDNQGKPLDLVNQPALGKVPSPFSLKFTNQAPETDPNTGLYKIDQSPDGLDLNFEFSDGRVVTKKSFKFTKDSYMVQVSTEVAQNGVLVPHAIEWRGGFGDETVPSAASAQRAVYYNLPNTKLVQNNAKTAKNGPVTTGGEFSFAGVQDTYFAAVFLPQNQSSVEVTTFSDTAADAKGSNEQFVGASVGGEGVNNFSLFVGPKDTDLLRKVDPKLEQLIDWGWFGLLAKPLFLVLNWTADHLMHNWGWTIILVTVVINLVLFPLRMKSMKSSKKMQKLQPQIAALNAKYKGISLRDPKKAEQNEEMMALYKREGVNPMGGCVPMLIQLPFLYAFYKVLEISIEMRGASWLWVHDLSQPETLAIRILPIILIITQFLTQKMTPSPGVDPSQQKMMLLMPLGLGYMFYFLSSGLVLYYLTSNLVSVGQQLLLNRSMKNEPPPPPVVDVKPASKKKR